MTKRKPKQTLYRDERGRFVSASVKIQEALATMRGKPVRFKDAGPGTASTIVPAFDYSRIDYAPAVDAIYRPKKRGWLERALTWFTWNRSRV